MVDSRWLFPEQAVPLVKTHQRFLKELDPMAQPLSGRGLSSYEGGPYLAGWKFRIRTSGGFLELRMLLDAKIPFSVPRIALAHSRYFLKWPHVEKDGQLCLRMDTDIIDHNAGIKVAQFYIEQAKTLIEDSMLGRTREDFISEFNSYWGRWCDRKRNNSQKVLMLSAPEARSRLVYRGVVGGCTVFCDTPEDGLQWARELFQDKSVGKERFQPAALIWLDASIYPEDYPRCNANVAALAKRARGKAFDMLLPLVPEPNGNMQVIFGFDSGNGPAFGALQLDDVPSNPKSKMKKDSRRLNGFRNKQANNKIIRSRFFSANAKTKAMSVQRIDRQWTFDRGSIGFNRQLDEAQVCLIGCGSLGAQVGQYLAQSGIGKFVLVDPDTLSWDNIGRHLLGGRDTEKRKVVGLKRHLESHFPGMLEVKIEPKEWQAVYSDKVKRRLLLESDLIVSTVGNWDAEAALNYTFNTTSDFPPVVYGWTEPFGIVGHALLTKDLGGCLACGMNGHGEFGPAVTKWEKGGFLKRPPACGQTYQPYGVTDIAPTQAMIARLCTDVITGKVTRSQHRTWVGDLSQLKEAGGNLADGLEKYYGNLGSGNRQVTNNWKMNKACYLKH